MYVVFISVQMYILHTYIMNHVGKESSVSFVFLWFYKKIFNTTKLSSAELLLHFR